MPTSFIANDGGLPRTCFGEPGQPQEVPPGSLFGMCEVCSKHCPMFTEPQRARLWKMACGRRACALCYQFDKTRNAARKLRINTDHYFHVMRSLELLEKYTSAIVEADPSQLQEVFPSQPILRSPAERRNARSSTLEHPCGSPLFIPVFPTTHVPTEVAIPNADIGCGQTVTIQPHLPPPVDNPAASPFDMFASRKWSSITRRYFSMKRYVAMRHVIDGAMKSRRHIFDKWSSITRRYLSMRRKDSAMTSAAALDQPRPEDGAMSSEVRAWLEEDDPMPPLDNALILKHGMKMMF